MPKVICGIIATISIVVIGFLVLSSFWFWTSWETIAGGLVAAGCWGEWYLFRNPVDEGDELQKLRHRRKELQCIIAVAIGVTAEFAALSHAIPEAVRLETNVVEIGTTNAQLSLQVAQLTSTNKMLQKQMDEQKAENQPISQVSAYVSFEVRVPWKAFRTNPTFKESLKTGSVAMEISTKRPWARTVKLVSETVNFQQEDTVMDDSFFLFSAQFRPDPPPGAIAQKYNTLRNEGIVFGEPVKLIEDIDSLQLTFPAELSDARISLGVVMLIFNDTGRTLVIPAQKFGNIWMDGLAKQTASP